MLRRATCFQLITIFSFVTALIFLCVLLFEFLIIKPGLFLQSTNISTALITEISPSMQLQEEKDQKVFWDQHRSSLEKTLELLPGFRQTVPNCSKLAQRKNFSLFRTARRWNFDSEHLRQLIFTNLTETSLKCTALKEKLVFFDKPLSPEEQEYPLAYGMLVYDSAIQIYLLLSAIYQPQNAYCIAVDAKSSEQFKGDMDLLADCFPNIFVMQISKVEWYTYSVVRGVWNCLRYLSQLSHPWKYYQYLSGVDLPLKTNLEMVRIFKKLNGTPNTDIRPIPMDRIQRVVDKTSPLQLYKSSLSALLARDSINAMMQAQRVRDLLVFAQQLECPDEALWATILGNPEQLVLPGTFNGSSVYKRTKEEKDRLAKRCSSEEKIKWMKNVSAEEPFALRSYYISRYQVWTYTPNTRCYGKYTHFSCVYGILDINALLSRPELVAHKFYLSVEPACYFCVYQHIRQRALEVESQKRFRGEVYSQLPQVQMSSGIESKNLKFYFTSCLMDD